MERTSVRAADFAPAMRLRRRRRRARRGAECAGQPRGWNRRKGKISSYIWTAVHKFRQKNDKKIQKKQQVKKIGQFRQNGLPTVCFCRTGLRRRHGRNGKRHRRSPLGGAHAATARASPLGFRCSYNVRARDVKGKIRAAVSRFEFRCRTKPGIPSLVTPDGAKRKSGDQSRRQTLCRAALVPGSPSGRPGRQRCGRTAGAIHRRSPWRPSIERIVILEEFRAQPMAAVRLVGNGATGIEIRVIPDWASATPFDHGDRDDPVRPQFESGGRDGNAVGTLLQFHSC